ncbi:hypothetical protein Tco_0915301, partial [Tanacetum coccineum]
MGCGRIPIGMPCFGRIPTGRESQVLVASLRGERAKCWSHPYGEREPSFGRILTGRESQVLVASLRGESQVSFQAWQLNIHKKNSSISSKPDRAYICTIRQFVRFIGEDIDWNASRTAILNRINVAYDDPLGELKKLKQTTHVQEYLMLLIDYYEEAKVNTVRQKLKPPILPTPRYQNQIPNSCPKLMALPTPNVNWRTKPVNGSSSSPFRKQLTQKELEEKRAKIQCFYCDQKYIPWHKCSGQVYSLEVLGDTNTELLDA